MPLLFVKYTLLFLCSASFWLTSTAIGWSDLSKLVNSAKGFFGFETCQEPWLQQDFRSLESFFETRLHGQHLVTDTTMKSLRGHLKDANPSKALVLSFHGLTGNGKNYVSKAIAEALFKKGMDSKFVHLLPATKYFSHERNVPIYSDMLSNWISSNSSQCYRNLFIFDEMDRMPPGVMDALKPFLDHYDSFEGVNYRKNIYIFLSNIGGKEISDFVIKHWNAGREREDIKLNTLEPILQQVAYNEGGLWRARMIQHGLVSAFIPFLPMQINHVKECIRDDLRRKGHQIQENLVNRIAADMEYFPADTRQFSTTGCKRVSQKVDINLEHDEL